jgi:hypothetical protein
MQSLKRLSLSLLAALLLLVSGLEFAASRSVGVIFLGIIAAALVLPIVRDRLHRGIRYLLNPTVTAFIVLGLLVYQASLTAAGVESIDQAKQIAEQQHLRELTFARRRALEKEFDANKVAILTGINAKVGEGNLTDALAVANKYDNADTDLERLKHQIRLTQLKDLLKGESDLTLEQRADAYAGLADLEPDNKQYAEKSAALNSQVAADKKAAADKAAKHAKLLAQFSKWDGSQPNVEYAIKERMNNPDSYKHVETRFTETPSGAIVYTKFRGTNGFGAIITTTAVATVDLDGSVTKLVLN